MSEMPSSALYETLVIECEPVANSQIDEEKLVGLRFSYLIKQLYDRAEAAGKKHGFYEELGAAIGCSGSLLHKWKDPEKVRKGLIERESINAKIIRGVRRAFMRSSEYFFVSAKDFPNHVVLADGLTRPAEPEEVDFFAPVFDLTQKREQIDTATRKQVAAHDDIIAELKAENRELRAQNSEIMSMLRRLLGNVETRR
jgi:hypothetical protein